MSIHPGSFAQLVLKYHFQRVESLLVNGLHYNTSTNSGEQVFRIVKPSSFVELRESSIGTDSSTA